MQARTPPTVERLHAVDGLRAIAMTAVVAQHCGLLPMGWMGVWLFFVISGYVITRGFLAEDARTTPDAPATARYRRFLKRRILRIVPAYVVYVGACLLVYAAPASPHEWRQLLSLLSFTYNWETIAEAWQPAARAWGVGHLWSLSVEQQFYLFFPLLFLGVSERWRWRLAVAIVLCSPLLRHLTSLVLTHTDPAVPALDAAYIVYACGYGHAESFLLGALLARYQADWLRPWVARLWAGLAAFCLVTYAAWYVHVNTVLGHHGIDAWRNVVSGILYGQHREVWVYSVVNLGAVVMMLVALSAGRLGRWLAWRPLQWVGRVSYGGYLAHVLAVKAVVALWAGGAIQTWSAPERVVGFALVMALTIAVASLSFVCIEQPLARRWRGWAAA